VQCIDCLLKGLRALPRRQVVGKVSVVGRSMPPVPIQRHGRGHQLPHAAHTGQHFIGRPAIPYPEAVLEQPGRNIASRVERPARTPRLARSPGAVARGRVHPVAAERRQNDGIRGRVTTFGLGHTLRKVLDRECPAAAAGHATTQAKPFGVARGILCHQQEAVPALLVTGHELHGQVARVGEAGCVLFERRQARARDVADDVAAPHRQEQPLVVTLPDRAQPLQ